MQNVARKTIRMVMKITRTVALLFAAGAVTSALAAVKPVAVWCGDFPTSNDGTDTRGGYTLSMNGNTASADGSIVTISSSATRGVTVMRATSTTPSAVVVGVSDIPSTKTKTVFLSRRTDSYYDIDHLALDTSKKIKFIMDNHNDKHNSNQIFGDGVHYVGISYDTSLSSGTSYYYDKTLLGAINWQWAARKMYGYTLGGCYNSATGHFDTYNAAGAKFNYVAVIESSATADIQNWSPTDMTSASSPETDTTLYASDNQTLVKKGINLPVGGHITISGDVTVAGMFAQGASEIRFADENSSLTISGPLYVAGDNTLKITPAALSSDTTKTLISASAIGSASNISVTDPPSGSEYVHSHTKSDTTITITRAEAVGFEYTATPNGGFHAGSTWFTSFDNYTTPAAYRVGPNTTYPIVYEVSGSNFNPYKGYTATPGFSFAIYADISAVANNNAVMIEFGTAANGLIMYINSDNGGNICLGRFTNSNIETGHIQVAKPSAGYHLYTVTCASDGTLKLYIDDGATFGTGSMVTKTAFASGFQVGSTYAGNINGMNNADKMAVVKVMGYDGVMTAEEVAALSAQYPASTGEITRDISMNYAGKTLRVYSSAPANGVSPVLGVDAGTIEIPQGETVTVAKVRTDPNNASGDLATITVAGTLNVTASDESVGSADLGVTLGYWMGLASGTRTSSLTITGSGVLNAPDAYVQIPWATHCQGAEFNVSGTAKIKGLYSNQSGKGTVTLANGGVLEVAEILSSGQAITKNFRYGTFRIAADAEETRAINFSAVSGYVTTLDPNGHTLTMAAAAMTGSAAVTVGGSNGGKVVFKGWTSSFTGTLQLTDANSHMIEVQSWADFVGSITGTLTIDDTNKDSLSLATFPWDKFTGTLNYAVTGGTLDLRGYDKSSNTINVTGSGATVLLTAGQEGTLNVSSGATAELYTDADTYYYLGHVYGSGMVEGTLVYKFTADSGVTYSAVAADAYNGNNLLPYYYVWTPSETANENTISANAAARWKSGSLPTGGKNVAFKISADTTVLVDATVTYGEVQVYGTGTLTFQSADGMAAMTVAKKFQTTSTTAVQIDGGIEFGANAGLEVVSMLPLYMSAINCGTEETPYSIPSITGGGIACVAENKYLSAGEVELGAFYVMGNATVSESAALGSLSVPASGVLTLDSANVAVSGTATAAIGGTVNVDATSMFTLGKVSGAGSVVWTGKQPDGSVWNTSAGWTGTNVVINATGLTDMNPANWGNASSFIKLNGVAGYFVQANVEATAKTTILEDNGANAALQISNGYQGNSVTFRKIAGDGTIADTHNHLTAWHMLIFKDATEFTGSIKATQASGCKKFVFSDAGNGTASASGSEGRLVVQSDGHAVIGAGKEWKPANSIHIAGEVKLLGAATMSKPVTINGTTAKLVLADTALTINNTLTFANGAKLTIDPGTIALSSTPATLITGLTNTEEPVVTGITVPGCTVSVGGTSGDYTIQATLGSGVWASGDGNWTETSFNGTEQSTDGSAVTFRASANDSVTVTLTGTRAPSTVAFNGASATTYTLTGGTFSPSGTVTVESGSVTIESAATGTYVVNTGAALSLTNATVTSVSGTGTLNIPAGGVVTLASATAIDSLSYITGEGELHVGANIPATTLNTLLKKSYTVNAETAYYWHGTVVIEDFVQTDGSTVAGTTLDCGNASSTIRLKNCTIRYFNNDASTAAAVEIVGTVKTLNGGSSTIASFGPLKGSGKFVSEDNYNVTHLYRFASSPDFAGSLSINGRRFVFGSEGAANNDTDKSTYKGTIRVSSGAVAALGENASWVAYYGIYINGTLIVNGANGYITSNPQERKVVFANGATVQFNALSAIKIGSAGQLAPTVASGSTVNITFGDGVTPVAGTKLISWGGAPEGSFVAVGCTLVKKSDGLYVSGGVDDGTAVVEDTEGVVTIPSGATAVSLAITGGSASLVSTTPLVVNGGGKNVTVYATDANGARTSTDISSAFKVTGENNTYTIELNEAVVQQNVTPTTFAEGGTPTLSMPAIPGLWYQVLAADSVDDGALVSPVGGTAVQATEATVSPVAPAFTGTVKFYKIAVGASKAALEQP